LQIIKNNPGIKAKEVPEKLKNRPLKTVQKQIQKLVDKKLIKRIGSKKTGGYQVISDNYYPYRKIHENENTYT